VKRPEGFDRKAPATPPAPAGKKSSAPPRIAQYKPAAQKPAAQKPAAQKPAAQKPAAQKPAPQKPAPQKSAPKERTPKQRPPRPTAGRDLRRAESARRRYERSEVRRFTRRSRRRRVTWLVAIICVLLLGGLTVGAIYSPLLSLKKIEVVGTSRVDKNKVLSALDGQLGTPLALVDFGRIRTELSAFPLIRSYVTESVPPDTLVVRISERTPIALLPTAQGFAVIDAAGVELQESATRPGGLPELTGGAALTKSAAFRAAIDVLLSISPQILAKVDSVTAATADNVTLTLVGGATVLWGSDEQSALKGRVLATLIANQPGASRYDVTAPTSAVYVPG
jgi:cell division protein FtsQ